MPFACLDRCRRRAVEHQDDDDDAWLAAPCVDVLARRPGCAVACVFHQKRYALAKVWDRARMERDPHSIASLANELAALRDARLGAFLALASDPRTVALITEYYPGGDLDTRRKRKGGTLSQDEVAFYAFGAFEALKALDGQGWAHRDVKPENLCIDVHGNVKLVDFGLAKHCKDGRCRTACGTVAFSSPEVCDVALGMVSDYDGHAADLWSLGCVLLELSTGNLAWDVDRRVAPGADAREALSAVRVAQRNLVPPPNILLVASPETRRAARLACAAAPPFVPRLMSHAPAAVARAVSLGGLFCN